MKEVSTAKSVLFFVGVLAFLLQISRSSGQIINEGVDPTLKIIEEGEDPTLGTGVNEEKDVMDTCAGGSGPRPINGVFSPGRTDFASVDDVNGGFCGVEIDRPGIWWWVEGTGDLIKVSSCNKQTNIKVKMSVFSGSCDELECVTGSEDPDFECTTCDEVNAIGEWKTFATAITFQSELEKNYYVLVQQADEQPGTIWLNFQTPIIPQNDNCVDAIGPVPRDMTTIENTNEFASISEMDDYCGGEFVPSRYPGTWFQVMGTGGLVSVSACSPWNFDGYAFSVYYGDHCDNLECVAGAYEVNIEDPDHCVFGSGNQRAMTRYTFDTIDRSRYYVYVHWAQTRSEKPTADFRFFVNDGREGDAGTSGAHVIAYEPHTTYDWSGYRDGTGRSIGRTGDEEGNADNEQPSSSSNIQIHRGLSIFVLAISCALHSLL